MPATEPQSTRSSSKSTWAMATSRWASWPGRTATCSSASSAVRLRRGSTTTTLPPRAWMALMRPGKSGAVHSEPLDSQGLAPSMSRWSVRSRSGTAMSRGLPNIRPLETCLGIWSTVLAE